MTEMEQRIATFIANELRTAATVHDANAHSALMNRQHETARLYREQANKARGMAERIECQWVEVVQKVEA